MRSRRIEEASSSLARP